MSSSSSLFPDQRDRSAPAAGALTRRYPKPEHPLSSPSPCVGVVYSRSAESVITQCQARRCFSKWLREASLFTGALLLLSHFSRSLSLSIIPPRSRASLAADWPEAAEREEREGGEASMMRTEDGKRERGRAGLGGGGEGGEKAGRRR